MEENREISAVSTQTANEEVKLLLPACLLVSKIIVTADYSIFTRNGLEPKHFVGYEKEAQFIADHHKLHGNVPDLVIFQDTFPEFPFYDTTETETYLVSRIYEEVEYQKFTDFLPELSSEVQKNSIRGYDMMKEAVAELKPMTAPIGIDIIANGKERELLYLNRNNCQVCNTISSGLVELDNIFGGWEFGDELVTMVARTNVGKCLARGTKVLMADGTFKCVEDIVVGDRVQSLNRVNTVVGTHNGISKGYKIVPTKGTPFTITDDHIITVYHRNSVWNPIDKVMSTDGEGEIIDLAIEDYLAKSKHFQRNCLLFRPSVDYGVKELEIPPYILGIWLGDGTSCCPQLTTNDKIIANAWEDYAHSVGLQVTVRNKSNTTAMTYDITSGILNKGKANLVKEHLKNLNVLNNKHIPLNYLTSSEEQRLELLAGILDTDGYYCERSNMYEIAFKSSELASNFCQLCNSLGFKVTKHIKHVKSFDKDYFRVNLFGDLNRIPCRLKKATKPTSKRNPQLVNFNVERVEEPFEYFGFECDGDHRFMLEDFTLTHNSWLMMKFLSEAWKQGYRVGLYSGEMNHLKLGYRFDALFGHFSNRALVTGSSVLGYSDYMRSIENTPTPFKIITQKDFGGKPTVNQIRHFVEANDIQIMGIDQFSLMADGRAQRGDPLRLQLCHVAEDLFLMSSECKIPVLALAQANREGIKRGSSEAPGLDNIKESDDIAANSSKCIGMKRDENNGDLILDIIKNREGAVGGSLRYVWDIDTGYFSYKPTDNDANGVSMHKQAVVNTNIQHKDDTSKGFIQTPIQQQATFSRISY